MKRLTILFCLAVLTIQPQLCSAGASQTDPISHETITRHARPRAPGEIFDSQEADPRLRGIFAEVDFQAEHAVRNVPRDKRFVFRFWLVKKQILKEKHGIDWKTPAELNPNISYQSYGQPTITAEELRQISAIIGPEARGKGEKIVSVERTFDGTVNVWTTVRNTRDRNKYLVTKVGTKWKITSRELP
jgi:hypothetical protein